MVVGKRKKLYYILGNFFTKFENSSFHDWKQERIERFVQKHYPIPYKNIIQRSASQLCSFGQFEQMCAVAFL